MRSTIRRIKWTTADVGELDGEPCPNCGAPLDPDGHDLFVLDDYDEQLAFCSRRCAAEFRANVTEG